MAERRIIQGFLETWYGLLRGVRQKSRCSHWRILFNWAIPVIFMVPLQAAGEGPEDSLESRIWSLVASYRFNDAMKEFRQLEKSDDERVSRRARYGSAITLLSVIPKTVGNIIYILKSMFDLCVCASSNFKRKIQLHVIFPCLYE